MDETKKGVPVTIPKDAAPSQRPDAILSWLRLEEIVQRSRLTEEDAHRIAEDIKADWWEANKNRFIPADEQ